MWESSPLSAATTMQHPCSSGNAEIFGMRLLPISIESRYPHHYVAASKTGGAPLYAAITMQQS